MREENVYINGIGTSLPKRKLDKELTIEIVSKISKSIPEKVISKLVDKSEIESRYVSNPMYSDLRNLNTSTKERMELYESSAPYLALESSKIALNKSNISSKEITHLITISCTGFYAPGIDCYLIEELGLPNTVNRIQLGFLGCHAALNGIGVALSIVNADPSAKVLLVAVEICSAHVSFKEESLIPNLIFSDGSASLVISSNKKEDLNLKINSQHSYLIPGTKSIMTWKIGDNGFNMFLSPELPSIIENNLGKWIFDNLKLNLENALWAIHPGGIRVLQATKKALKLSEEDICISKEVLKDYGNMSSPTVIFILERLLEKRKSEPVYMLGFGPGLFCECITLS